MMFFTKIIYKLLTATCRQCGRILISDAKAEEYRAAIEKTRKMLGTVPVHVFDAVKKEAKKHSDSSESQGKEGD